MTPSVLAHQVQQGVEDFLRTTFPVSTPHFHGVVDRLIEEQGSIFKGPYVSVKLPFREGEIGPDYFDNVPVPFKPYLHQEQAFRRLSADPPRPTLIATGTGSGKTESFLVPILDHCYRHREEPGIKALLIYPMNALANNQASRLAKMIWDNPQLKGEVTAGLYVGQRDAHPRMQMTPEAVITDKETMRLQPPDILMTNYKMLDYLLIRPDDFPLWQQNDPETLQFLVVDELHTFDGAQGTDLACLIRRLKERLRTPEGHLCSIGTSATLGGPDAKGDLLAYAESIFGEPFDEEAVIMESRQTDAEFLKGALVRSRAPVQPDKSAALEPNTYDDFDQYVSSQVKLWFGDEVVIKDFAAPEWRVKLGELLKGHPFFRNLLSVLRGRSRSLDEIIRALARVTPELETDDAGYRRHLIESMLALISVARNWTGESNEPSDGTDDGEEPPGTAPFLDVRVQLWLRELRRMVASVEEQPVARFFDDLTDDQRRHHLPIIHCRDCGSMGWAALRRPHDQSLDTELKQFYQAYFDYHPNVEFIFPDPDPSAGLDGMSMYLLPERMVLEVYKPDEEEKSIRVFIPNNTRTTQAGLRGNHDCPYCGSQDSLTILGSRAASLTSVLITQLYASTYNDDKKLITFSDSVQDASHRASFFAARTYRFNMRSAIQQCLEREGGSVRLDELAGRFKSCWAENWDEPTYLSTFIAPDMQWLRDYEHLAEHGKLPDGSDLPALVDQRVKWEIFSEYGFRSRIGRTLEKSGASIAHPDREALDAVTENLLEVLRNEIGELRELDGVTLSRFLTGLLAHLRTQGGIYHPVLEELVRTRGKTWYLTRILYMPGFGLRTRIPSFVTTDRSSRFDPLIGGGLHSRTWYEAWANKCFSGVNPLITGSVPVLYHHVFGALVEADILRREDTQGESTWGIRPEALYVTSDVGQVTCDRCGHSTSVAEEDLDLMDGTPCLRFHCSGRYERSAAVLDYYGKLYATGDVTRIVAHEHTGLLARDVREYIEEKFMKGTHAWDPNLLSCTPTLEMGIDIGDLSSVILCSVPPAQANYLQRIGRAGRRDGNALNLAVANGTPHDLYFYAEPKEMIEGRIDPPGVYLNAAAVLERQFTAYCMDRWVETGISAGAIPSLLRKVLNNLESPTDEVFPHNFIGFVAEHRKDLLAGFTALFGNDLSEEAREYIKAFAAATSPDDQPTLATRILNGLHTLQRERLSLRKEIKRLRNRVRQMEQQDIRDQNYDRTLQELRQELQALRRIVSEKIERRQTLNFMTDEGLLPNYAFPEAGVTLRSIIYRKKSESDDESGFETRIFEYERPAVSALSELAPSNKFYAEGRNVAIDQIDLGVSDVELWRFCDNCSYSELQVGTETASTCPRCESPMWSDAGQERQMVRMRQVFATSSDKRSRTSDDSDDRNPLFYNKQLLVDFEQEHVTNAYRIADDELPFGFEFLSKASFREINFGKLAVVGTPVRIAGEERPRNGFKVCRHCGKVQDRHSEKSHSYACPAREDDEDTDYIDCLYLYREFSSEAIRILLPVTTFAGSDQTLHSFIAALQLGLRKKFRGNIDHLQVTAYEEPITGSIHRRKYLILYDTVPGGTGYLKELMRSTEPLLDVFKSALATMRSCECNADPEKDGCYQCLYAHRNSYDMPETSRDRAVEILSKVVQHEDDFEEIESLRIIPINALFESELEARFIEALKRAGTKDVPVEVGQQIVGHKPGYFLKIGEESYYIEPQVELGSADGVAIPSRADFVISPARASSEVKPIAVFADGWIYHRDRIGDDLLQRMAIVRSGRYHVWSLTWKDVEEKLRSTDKHFDNYLASELNLPQSAGYGQLVVGLDDAYGTESLRDLPKQDSLTWLLRFLQSPEPKVWAAHAAIQSFLCIDPSRPDDPQEISRRREALGEVLPSGVGDLVTDIAPEVMGIHEPSGRPVQLVMAAEKSAVSQVDVRGVRFVALLADREDEVGVGHERAWNGYLRLYNLMQFLPQSFFLTTRGIDAGLYDEMASLRDVTADIAASAESDAWQEVRDLVDEEVLSLLDAVSLDSQIPEVGFELTDERGVVIGMAELAWPDTKTALLLDNQDQFRSHFESAGWTVVALDEAVDDPTTIMSALTVNE